MHIGEYRRPSVSTFEDSENEESQDQFDEKQLQKIQKNKAKPSQRISVSAEVYGEFNKKGDFNPPVNKKTEEETSKIIEKIDKSFLFKHLEKKEKQIIALAMAIKKYKSGEMVIK